MQHGSAKQVLLVLAIVMWIAIAVAGAFYAAFVNYLEVTVACATMATCVTASLWVYLGLLELRQHYRSTSDSVDALRRRIEQLETLLKQRLPKEAHRAVAPGAPISEATGSQPADLVEIETQSGKLRAARAMKAAARPPINGHRNGTTQPQAAPVHAPQPQSEAARLREEFATFIREHDLEGALATGDEIVRQYPQSRLAHEFLSLRPYLVHRMTETELTTTTS